MLDETAVIAALREGRLGDVFESEPLSAASGEAWRELPSLLLTPHIAGVTEESNVR